MSLFFYLLYFFYNAILVGNDMNVVKLIYHLPFTSFSYSFCNFYKSQKIIKYESFQIFKK